MVLMDLKPIARGCTCNSCNGTSGAGRSSGAGSTTELNLEFFANLMNADDPVMQQLGSLLSAEQAKNDDLEKRLAASEEKARIS